MMENSRLFTAFLAIVAMGLLTVLLVPLVLPIFI
jgi:hypothetical protein